MISNVMPGVAFMVVLGVPRAMHRPSPRKIPRVLPTKLVPNAPSPVFFVTGANTTMPVMQWVPDMGVRPASIVIPMIGVDAVNRSLFTGGEFWMFREWP